MLGASTADMAELSYPERKRIHNLKYFTWVEQQGKTSAALDALWDPGWWEGIQGQVPAIDHLIEEFTRRHTSQLWMSLRRFFRVTSASHSR